MYQVQMLFHQKDVTKFTICQYQINHQTRCIALGENSYWLTFERRQLVLKKVKKYKMFA